MTTYWRNKTKVIVLTILIIIGGAIGIQRASGGTYTDSIHGGGWSGKGIPGVNRSAIDSQYSTYAPGNCAHCHEAHASLDGSEPAPSNGFDAGPDNALLFSEEEDLCEKCHQDIQTILDDWAIKHPVDDYRGRHTMSKLEWDKDGDPFRDANRHAECCDCHNPHTIGGIDKTTPKIHPTGTSSPNRDLNGNSIYNTSIGTACLQGVWGVEPSGTYEIGNPPLQSSFTETIPSNDYPRYAEKEYQICFKCHSNYAFNSAGTYPDDVRVAAEFSELNKSGHPVMVIQDDRSGSDSPRKLGTYQVGWPADVWRTNRGLTTMYCSDCHGSHLLAGAQGVHGAEIAPGGTMLRGFSANNMGCWPNDPWGNYWTLNKVLNDTSSWKSYLFCRNCHAIYNSNASPPEDQWANRAHFRHSSLIGVPGYPEDDLGTCVYCHVRRVHGSELGRLLGGGEFDGYRPLQFRKKSDPKTMVSEDCYNGPGLCLHGGPID